MHSVPRRITRNPVGGSESYSIDVSYGINGEVEGQPITAPCDRLDGTTGTATAKLSAIKNPSMMVMLFDGVWLHLEDTGYRLSPRHIHRTFTNISFFDGHVETWNRGTLPGDNGDGTVFGNVNTLDTVYANQPQWNLGQ